jgi:hypothetical protein
MNRYSISMFLRRSGRNTRREGSFKKRANAFRFTRPMAPNGCIACACPLGRGEAASWPSQRRVQKTEAEMLRTLNFGRKSTALAICSQFHGC